tara:strand:- start:7072 stop:7209 length:138 start_codon:yes stop_codon:yes gene_type:complete
MLKMKKKIAIQGTEGSNHHKVARDFYGNTIAIIELMASEFKVLGA